MGSFPSAALQVHPGENPLDAYAKAISVRSMLQGQQLQQQQIQGAGLENQIRQQQLNDVQATTQAMRDWDGKNYDQLYPLIIKHGGSAQAVMGLKNTVAGYQEKISTIAKNDSETQAKNLDTLVKRHDQALGALQAATDESVPDDQLATSISKAKNQQLLAGNIDQGQADGIDKILATGDPRRIRSSLDILEKSMMGAQQIHKNALEERDTAAKEWKEFPQLGMLVNTRNGDVKSPTGDVMSPGMMESKYVSLQAQKARGQALSDQDQAFVKGYEHMKTLVPMFNFNLQAGGFQGTNPLPPREQATAQAINEGRMSPPGSFALKTPYWQNVMGEVFRQDPQWSEQRAQLRKDFTVGKHSNEINAINTAMAHVGQLGNAIDALNNGDIKALNSIANFYNVQTGKDAVTTFNTIVHRVGPEIAKAYLASGGSAGERGADEKDFDPSLGPQQLRSNIGVTSRLLRSKVAALENQWNQNKSDSMPSFQQRFIMPEASAQLDKWAPQTGGPAAGPAPKTGGLEVGQKVKIKGKDMTVTAVHPDGSFDAK